jgi:hypothetical protein
VKLLAVAGAGINFEQIVFTTVVTSLSAEDDIPVQLTGISTDNVVINNSTDITLSSGVYSFQIGSRFTPGDVADYIQYRLIDINAGVLSRRYDMYSQSSESPIFQQISFCLMFNADTTINLMLRNVSSDNAIPNVRTDFTVTKLA